MNDLKILTPDDQAKRLLTIRYKRDQIRAKLNLLDAEYDALRDALLAETQKHNVLTLKTDNYTISRKKSKSVLVHDHHLAIIELERSGYLPAVRLDTRAMGQGIYKAIEEGDAPSCEVRVTEYISITPNKKAV